MQNTKCTIRNQFSVLHFVFWGAEYEMCHWTSVFCVTFCVPGCGIQNVQLEISFLCCICDPGCCNIPLHLVTVPGNCTHEGLLRHIPMSCGPLIWFVTASHYVIVSTVPIVIDMTHYVIVTTVFSPNTLFCNIAL